MMESKFKNLLERNFLFPKIAIDKEGKDLNISYNSISEIARNSQYFNFSTTIKKNLENGEKCPIATEVLLAFTDLWPSSTQKGIIPVRTIAGILKSLYGFTHRETDIDSLVNEVVGNDRLLEVKLIKIWLHWATGKWGREKGKLYQWLEELQEIASERNDALGNSASDFLLFYPLALGQKTLSNQSEKEGENRFQRVKRETLKWKNGTPGQRARRAYLLSTLIRYDEDIAQKELPELKEEIEELAEILPQEGGVRKNVFDLRGILYRNIALLYQNKTKVGEKRAIRNFFKAILSCCGRGAEEIEKVDQKNFPSETLEYFFDKVSKSQLYCADLAGQTCVNLAISIRDRLYEFMERQVHLFSVEKNEKATLNKKGISKSIQEKFKDHNITFRQKPKVKVSRTDKEWEITDDKRKWLIRNESQTLNVYHEKDPFPQQKISSKLAERILKLCPEVKGFSSSQIQLKYILGDLYLRRAISIWGHKSVPSLSEEEIDLIRSAKELYEKAVELAEEVEDIKAQLRVVARAENFNISPEKMGKNLRNLFERSKTDLRKKYNEAKEASFRHFLPIKLSDRFFKALPSLNISGPNKKVLEEFCEVFNPSLTKEEVQQRVESWIKHSDSILLLNELSLYSDSLLTFFSPSSNEVSDYFQEIYNIDLRWIHLLEYHDYPTEYINKVIEEKITLEDNISQAAGSTTAPNREYIRVIGGGEYIVDKNTKSLTIANQIYLDRCVKHLFMDPFKNLYQEPLSPELFKNPDRYLSSQLLNRIMRMERGGIVLGQKNQASWRIPWEWIFPPRSPMIYLSPWRQQQRHNSFFKKHVVLVQKDVSLKIKDEENNSYYRMLLIDHIKEKAFDKNPPNNVVIKELTLKSLKNIDPGSDVHIVANYNGDWNQGVWLTEKPNKESSDLSEVFFEDRKLRDAFKSAGRLNIQTCYVAPRMKFSWKGTDPLAIKIRKEMPWNSDLVISREAVFFKRSYRWIKGIINSERNASDYIFRLIRKAWKEAGEKASKENSFEAGIKKMALYYMDVPFIVL